MRRFHARKFADDNMDSGEIWQIIDLDGLRVAGLAENKHQAEVIADALEYLSLHVEHAESEWLFGAAA